MNKNLFRRVFSKHQGMLVAVAEHVKGHGKRAGESRAPALTAERGIISTLTAIALALLSFDAIEAKAQGLPTGGQVAAGQATISQPNGSTMNINQASQRAVLDWNTFNIGQGNTVQFQQPNAQAQALNRVTGRSMADNAAAVLAGDLDVAQVFEPHAALAESQGAAVWHRAADRGPSAYTAFYATEQRITERSAEFEAMIRAMAAALAWIAQAPPTEIAGTVASLFPEVPLPALTTALARYQGLALWSPTPHFPRAAFEQLRGAMQTAGILQGSPAFDVCVDEAIVARALGA